MDTSICGYFFRLNHTSSLPRLSLPSASSSSSTGASLGTSKTGSSFFRYLSEAAHNACDLTMGLLNGSSTAASEARLKKSIGFLMKYWSSASVRPTITMSESLPLLPTLPLLCQVELMVPG